MELIVLILFAWFLFILGKCFKDFTITFISGLLIIFSGISVFQYVGQINFVFGIVNLFLGLYITYRSLIELIKLYFKDMKGGKNAVFKTKK